MPYYISTVDYLRRAAEQIRAGSKEALFYAALELRSGVERRSHEYLEPQHHVPEGRKLDYRIPRLAKNLEKISLPDDQVMRCTLIVGDSETTVYYVPVAETLRNNAMRLGAYLHAQDFRPDDSPEWGEFRELVLTTYQELLKAASGELLGAALLDPETSQGRLHLMIGDGSADIDAAAIKGQRIELNVEHLESVPTDRIDAFLAAEGLPWDPTVEDS